MITIALLHSHYDQDHLAAVMAEMQNRGAPTIKAVKLDDNLYAALEGCHRLRAAKALGLMPEIVKVEYSDERLCDVVDDDADDYAITVEMVADSAHRAKLLTFEPGQEDE